MSVTSILNYSNKTYKDYRTALAQIEKPRLRKVPPEIKAKPKTSNYALVGTAFDYLIRFTLEKKYKTFVSGETWLAEYVINSINYQLEFGSKSKMEGKVIENIKARYTYVKDVFYKSYIDNYQDINNDLLRSCLFLAKLDSYDRSYYLPITEIDFFSESAQDIEDLKQLIEVCNLELFKPNQRIILNPTFGKSSSMVGGADADLIIDNNLIEIKVTKELSLTRNYFNQLITYYLLDLNEKLENREFYGINKLTFYFARYGYSVIIPVSKVGSEESLVKILNVLKSLTSINKEF